jgi:hypothetical protein
MWRVKLAVKQGRVRASRRTVGQNSVFNSYKNSDATRIMLSPSTGVRSASTNAR